MRAKTAGEAASSRATPAMTARTAKAVGGSRVFTVMGVDDSSEPTVLEHKHCITLKISAVLAFRREEVKVVPIVMREVTQWMH